MTEQEKEWRLAVIEAIREVRDVLTGMDESLRALRTTENHEVVLMEKQAEKS